MTKESLYSYLSIFIALHFLILTFGYLNQREISVLNELYNEWNAKYWSPCLWNLTIINNTNKNNCIKNHCGLHFKNYSNKKCYQYVDQINFGARGFYFMNNVTGTVPSSIGNLSHLTQFRPPYYNELYGTIPTQFCNFINLTQFRLYGNMFDGTIPFCLFELSHLDELTIMDLPNVTLYWINIEQLCNHTNITWIEFDNINYIGHIPNCIGYNLKKLKLLVFSNMRHLNGTIPSSINNLIKLRCISLLQLPSISIKNTTQINLQNFQNLDQISLDLEIVGVNLADLCKLKLIQIDLYNYNENNPIFIPNECIFKKSNTIFQLTIAGNGFVGSIDQTLCTQRNLLAIFIIQDTKYMDINIPECLQYFNQLNVVQLTNNTFLKGSLPTYSLNSSYLQFVQIQNNKKLTGSISHLLTNYSFKNLRILALDNNDFFDENINELLKNVFVYSPNLQLLTLHKNRYLSGSLPQFDKDIYLDNLHVLTLHNLDIYGSISNKIHLARNISTNDSNLFSLYGNRMSGPIPNSLFPSIKRDKQFDMIILPGNKFTIFDAQNEDNSFMQNSLFIECSHLYITRDDSIISYIMGIIAFVFVFVYLWWYLYDYVTNNTEIVLDDAYLFLFNLKTINNLLFDPFIIVLVIISTIFYFVNSNYYTDITFLARLSAFNFYSNYVSTNIIFSTLITLFNVLMIFKIFKITDNIEKFKYDQLNDEQVMLIEYRLSRLNSTINDHDGQSDIDIDNNNKNVNNNWLYLYTFFYIMVYIFVLCLVFSYGLFSSLPSNNWFKIDSYYTLKAITFPLSLILSITKSIITPKLVTSVFKSFNISFKYRSNFILFLRTLMMIIIPLLSSLFFINQCGNAWTYFWNYCSKQKRKMFNIDVSIQTKGVITKGRESGLVFPSQLVRMKHLLTSNEVCNVQIPSSDGLSKCFASFYYLWTNILFESVIIMFFMPFFIILGKIVKNSCFNKYFKNRNYLYLSIDSEYVMIISKLEICLVFTVFSPLLFPLIVCVLKWNEVFYSFIIYKLKWDIKFSYNNNLPLYYLYIALLIQHILSFQYLFYYQYASNQYFSKIASTIFVSIIFLIYIIMIYKKYKKHNTQ